MRFKFPTVGKAFIPKPHAPRYYPGARFKMRFVNKGHRITDYGKRWRTSFLHRAGGSIRAWAIKRFKRVISKRKHSQPGKTPFAHVPKSQFLRVAIQFAADVARGEVLIGPVYSICKIWGRKHEHGGVFKVRGGGVKARYPKRAFMKPEFERWQRHRYGMRKLIVETRQWAYKEQ